MSQIATLKAAGLQSYPNQLSYSSGYVVQTSTPAGSLAVANDVVINRDNVIEPRRGFAVYGNAMGSSPSVDYAKQLITYKQRLFRHWGPAAGTTLDFDNGSGTFTSFSAAISEVVQGIRIKYQESNGNLYLTSNTGIQKVSVKNAADLATSGLVPAGIPEALDITLSLNTAPGFFNQESAVAYRVLWGIKDANTNLILGAPSNRQIIYNPVTSLLVDNFNTLLATLDTINQPNGIHYKSYYSSYAVAKNASAASLRQNLLALTTELDADIATSSSYNVAANVTDAVGSVSGNTITLVSGAGVYVGQQVSLDTSVLPTAVTGTTSTTSNVITLGSSLSVNAGMNVTCISSGIILANTTVAVTSSGTSVTISSIPIIAGTFTASFIFSNPNPFPLNTTVTNVSGTTVTLNNTTTGTAAGYNNIVFSSLYSNLASSTIIPANTPVASTPTTNTSTNGLTYNVTAVLTSTPAILKIGDPVQLSGVVPATYETTNAIVQSVVGNVVVFNVQTNPGVYVSGTGKLSRYTYEYLAQPTALSTTPLTNELLSMQVYYQSILTLLQQEATIIVGTPNPFTNLSVSNNATVNLSFPIPAGITTANFYQAYRTRPVTAANGTSLSSYDPGDEEYLAFEANPTAQDLTNGYISFQDIEPDTYLGASLYTNANSGNGITTANVPPPLAQDMTLYYNYMFYSNTISYHSLNTTLLGVANMTSGTSSFTISNGTTTNTYTFVNGVAQVSTVATVADVSGSLNSKYFTLSSAKNATKYYVWYNVAGAGVDPAVAGATGIQVALNTNDANTVVAQKTLNAFISINDFNQSISGHTLTITNVSDGVSATPVDHSTGFTLTVTTAGNGENPATKQVVLSTLPTPAQQITETAQSLVNVINRNSSEIVYAFYESGPTSVPGQILLQGRTLGAAAFTITANNTATGNEFNPAVPTSGSTTDNTSQNDARPNRLYYSTQFQPDAVPIVNYIDIGPEDEAILRVVGLRQSLFIFKEEGIYRLTGNTSQSFVVALFDSSSLLTAPDSAAVLNNTIYCLTNQGVVNVSDNGVSILSRPIEGSLIELNNALYPNFSAATFGIGYESDRTYNLWTVSNTTDVLATTSFRYNTITQAWTACTKTANCGVINTADNKMYLGATDINYIEQERKNFDRTDYSDRQYDFSLGANVISGYNIVLNSLTNVSVGDVVQQIQYLTIAQFNRLILKLNNDAGIKTNYAPLLASSGVSLRNSLTLLATQLDSDPGTNTKTYSSSISGFTSSFPDTQAAFNVIIGLLNSDTGLRFKNYLTSTGTVSFEINITELTSATNTITTQYAYPFIQGTITIYNHIHSEVQWLPAAMGDPSMSKQVSDATIIFEKLSFTDAQLFFSTDLNPGFVEQDFPESGNGSFGAGVYGETTYGDSGNAIPLRTYIPQQLQRCRFINVQFQHGVARESFAIFGVSLTYNQTSQRAWR